MHSRQPVASEGLTTFALGYVPTVMGWWHVGTCVVSRVMVKL